MAGLYGKMPACSRSQKASTMQRSLQHPAGPSNTALFVPQQATKGKQTMTFYTLPEYEAWKENNSTRGWAIKYYKGLGTSTAKVSGIGGCKGRESYVFGWVVCDETGCFMPSTCQAFPVSCLWCLAVGLDTEFLYAEPWSWWSCTGGQRVLCCHRLPPQGVHLGR